MKQLTTELALSLLGGFLIFAVAGGMTYLFFVEAKVADLEPKSTSYNVAVIASEMKKTPEASNVFIRMSKLGQPVPQVVQATTTYLDGDLGKTNIGLIGQ